MTWFYTSILDFAAMRANLCVKTVHRIAARTNTRYARSFTIQLKTSATFSMRKPVQTPSRYKKLDVMRQGTQTYQRPFKFNIPHKLTQKYDETQRYLDAIAIYKCSGPNKFTFNTRGNSRNAMSLLTGRHF